MNQINVFLCANKAWKKILNIKRKDEVITKRAPVKNIEHTIYEEYPHCSYNHIMKPKKIKYSYSAYVILEEEDDDEDKVQYIHLEKAR